MGEFQRILAANTVKAIVLGIRTHRNGMRCTEDLYGWGSIAKIPTYRIEYYLNSRRRYR